MDINKLLWMYDPAHAWLRVPRDMVQGYPDLWSGNNDPCSDYSYQDSEYFYFEEDRDALIFLKAHKLIDENGVGSYKMIPEDSNDRPEIRKKRSAAEVVFFELGPNG
tara:strand:+ start:422 stop:742 length:321 start_codon:yes stop_codon:yes gene_type:complete